MISYPLPNIIEELVKNSYFRITNNLRKGQDSIYENNRMNINVKKIKEVNYFESLLHELCHFAEVTNPKRLFKTRYGLTISPIIDAKSELIKIHKATNAMERELRTFAYQWNLHDEFKLKFHPIKEINTVATKYPIKQFLPESYKKSLFKKLKEYKKIYTVNLFIENFNKNKTITNKTLGIFQNG